MIDRAVVDYLDLGDYEWDRSVLDLPQCAGTVRSVEDLRSVITEWAAHPIFTCVDDRLLCRVCVVGGRDFGCCSRAVVVGGLGQSRAATAWN